LRTKKKHHAQLQAWEAECQLISKENQAHATAYKTALSKHLERQEAYEAQQIQTNAKIDKLHEDYSNAVPEAIEQYCHIVLSSSRYPDCCPQTFELCYQPEGKTLIVDYLLPAPGQMPRIKSVKFVQADDGFEEMELSEVALKKLYGSVVYQISVRTLHELFEADVVDGLEAIVFNGVVETIDPRTGHEIRPCILSVQATKKEFEKLNLSRVDPKECIRMLKGVGSSQLHMLAPIAPIMRLPTEDVRYIEGRKIIDGVNEGANLASMDWEDFEHLIRELFEREFGSSGTQVKVTRASHDGGVDAVVLDPDPIRGGKFVIQAKRYTNTVAVGAVRDLYGTMINEGAVKGLLVTTATFGPDSYEFAKDKPITLIDGSNLLHLLSKHGKQAHIDLKEAKLAMAG
jgi:restriction system protein